MRFITPILKSLVIPVIWFWLALIGAIYLRIAPTFASNCIFFLANEEATPKTKQPIRFQGVFKVTEQIARKWKTKSVMWQILQLLFPKLLFFSPPKMDDLISNRLSTASIKYLNWPSPVFRRFQNGCNKVVIEPRVVQFWSEIILVITDRACAAHSIDFEITHMISAQIALHSVQLPLFIVRWKKNVACPLWTTILYWFTELCVVEISQSTTKWSFHESKTNYCPQNIPPNCCRHCRPRKQRAWQLITCDLISFFHYQ